MKSKNSAEMASNMPNMRNLFQITYKMQIFILNDGMTPVSSNMII